MLRGFRPTGENGNRSQAPSGRSGRNLCVREIAKELRIGTGSMATQFVLCDRLETVLDVGTDNVVVLRDDWDDRFGQSQVVRSEAMTTTICGRGAGTRHLSERSAGPGWVGGLSMTLISRHSPCNQI